MSPWRPLPEDRAARDPRPVAESLDRVADSIGAPKAAVLATIFSRWEALVGAQIASHATPLSLRSGVLVVAVDQPAWATQLRYLAPELLGRIREIAGEDEVSEVSVRVRPEAGGRRGG
ncbi:MAG: DciA family protein [Acidimicrobiales bacterium]